MRRALSLKLAALLLCIAHSGTLSAAPIHEAVEKGDAAAVRRALAADPKAIEATDAHEFTPLMVAADRGTPKIAALLLSAGAAVEAKTTEGVTPLMLAARKGRLELMQRLLAAGAAPDAATIHGVTPLMQAAQNGQPEAAKLLLEKGAAVDARDSEGITPLMVAAMNNHAAVMRVLLEKGATIGATTTNGFNALMFATDDKHLDALKLLLEKGAPVDGPAPADAGLTCLMHAASSGYLEAMKVLLEKGAALEAKDKNGWTALLAAADNGKIEAVKLLLDKGAVVDSRAEDGSTPLAYAAYSGHLDVVKLLVEKGASIAARDHDGNSAFMLAEAMDHADVVEYLRAPTAAAFGLVPPMNEELVLGHLIDQADSDGFASLRGESRTADEWTSLTMPVGAQDCSIDWRAKAGDKAHPQLRAVMLITKDRDEAVREYLRVLDLVALVVPWRDARLPFDKPSSHAVARSSPIAIEFEPHAEGKPHRTIVVRYDRNESANNAYFVQLQIDGSLRPSWYRQKAENSWNNMEGYIKADVDEFLAAAAQGFEFYKTGDGSTEADGLRRWESSRKPALASYADIQQRGDNVAYFCILETSPYQGELVQRYRELVSLVVGALPATWSKSDNLPFGGLTAEVEYVSTDGMKGQMWVSYDSRAKYDLCFQIVSNRPASGAPDPAAPVKPASGPDDDDPIGSGGFIKSSTN